MHRVLITGGAGYIGTKLTKCLVELSQVDQIYIYDNLSRANFNLFLGDKLINNHKVKFIAGDLLDSRKLRQVINDHNISIVYHLAARVTTPFANTEAHFHEQVNHWGTSELVMAIEESKVDKFIYTSSTSVYGSSDDYVWEGSLPNPKTFYGISKYRGEQHVKRLFDKLDTITLN